QPVRHQTIDFLGHGFIETAQTRFHVSNRNTEVRRRIGCGGCGIDVAHDQHQIGPVLTKHRIKAHHDPCRLRRGRSRADAKIDVRLRNRKFFKEDAAHGDVVVLAGMNDARAQSTALGERTYDGGDLYEIRPCSYDTIDMPSVIAGQSWWSMGGCLMD